MASFSDRVCVQADRAYSYDEITQLADSLFRDRERSLGMILCDRTVDTLMAYLGCLRNRMVPILLPVEIGAAALARLLDVYRPSFLVMPEIAANRLSIHAAYKKFQWRSLSFFYLDSHPVVLHEDLALLLTTSGSTGDPKLVRLSAQNIDSNARSIQVALSIEQDSCPINLLPLHYSFGLSVIHSHLLRGCRFSLTTAGIAEREFWDVFKTTGVTSLYGVPYHFEMLKKFRFERMSLPSLGLMAQAGGRMQLELQQYFYNLGKKKGFEFVCMYGQTEATARMTILPTAMFEEHSSSVGKAIPGGVLKIESADANGVGEVVYSGPNVFLGYADCADDLSHGDQFHGVLHTGDIGLLDAEGYLYLKGRKKRFVKIFGHSISLDHLEHLSRAVEPQTVVVGRDDKVIFLLPQASIEKVRQHLVDNASIQASALEFIACNEFPMTPSGKIDYNSLGIRYLSDDPSSI